MDFKLRKDALLPLALLFLMSALLTITLQRWVGQTILYDHVPSLAREIHYSILHNQLPQGRTWQELGANGTNIRVFVVYLAESLSRLAHRDVLAAYYAIDTISLFLFFVLLFFYLRNWVSPQDALIGLLAYAFFSILSYHLFRFHPWDRIAMLPWLAILWTTYKKRFVPLLILLPIAMTIKYDVILLPILYGAHLFRSGERRRAVVESVILMVVVVGTYLALQRIFPGGFLQASVFSRDGSSDIFFNLSVLRTYKFAYPPFLIFSLPILLNAIYFKRLPEFPRTAALFAVGLQLLMANTVHFAEVRAQMPVLLLYLPGTLLGLGMLFRDLEKTAPAGI
jgi:hypothetical protein